jgi:ankyrin repeat protein
VILEREAQEEGNDRIKKHCPNQKKRIIGKHKMIAIYTLIQKSLQDGRRRRRHQNAHFDEQDGFTEASVQFTTDQSPEEETCQEVGEELKDSPVSFLYSLASRWAWNAVIFRCETHPQECDVKYRDGAGDTVLHWACFGVAPLNVVEALLEVCPDLAKAQNHIGHLPLHVACSYRASCSIIRALVSAYPQGAGIPNGAGSYSLHILCDYGCSAQSIQAILETKEGAQSVMELDSIYRRTPLYILHERTSLTRYRRTVDELRSVRQRQREIIGDKESDGISEPDQAEMARLEASMEHHYEWDYWDKAQRLVLAEFLGRPLVADDVDRPGVLHACVGIRKCPPSLLELALLLKVDQLLEIDKEGRLPLHLACAVSTPACVSEVLSACPRAACTTDSKGNLPLSIFLQHHSKYLSWVGPVEEMIFANPIALETLGLDTRLYPRIWSRFSTIRSPATRTRNIRALYESIRGNPTIFAR